MKVVARSYFDDSRVRPVVDFSKDVELTKQSFKDEVNVNKIIERATRTGIIPGQLRNPMYGDFSKVGQFQDAINVVMRAEQQFAGLDAKLRARFSNDPGKFLQFVEDPKNVDELVNLGLATRRAKVVDGSTQPPVGQGGGAGIGAGATNPQGVGQTTPQPAAATAGAPGNGGVGGSAQGLR